MRLIVCGTCGKPLTLTENIYDSVGETYRSTQHLACPMCDNSIIIHEKSRKERWYHNVRKIIMGEV